jgi:hypothetical protein
VNVNDMRARVARLRSLAQGLGQEVKRWKAEDGPLTPAEQRIYLNAIQDVIAGADEGAVVLLAAIGRLEALGLPGVVGGEVG